MIILMMIQALVMMLLLMIKVMHMKLIMLFMVTAVMAIMPYDADEGVDDADVAAAVDDDAVGKMVVRMILMITMMPLIAMMVMRWCL